MQTNRFSVETINDSVSFQNIENALNNALQSGVCSAFTLEEDKAISFVSCIEDTQDDLIAGQITHKKAIIELNQVQQFALLSFISKYGFGIDAQINPDFESSIFEQNKRRFDGN